MRRSDRLQPLLWITADLTYSFSIITPSGEKYKGEGYETADEAREARNLLGMKLQLLGKGVWVDPVWYKPKLHYTRRGTYPSPHSFLTDVTTQGDPRLGRLPESLPDVPGRIADRRRTQ